MIDLGETEFLERELPQPLDRLVDKNLPAAHRFEKLPNPLLGHGLKV